MKKVKVIVEKTNTGYSAYLPDVPGIAFVGDTFSELRENIKEAIDLYLEVANEYGDKIPTILQSEYSLEFKFDIGAFME